MKEAIDQVAKDLGNEGRILARESGTEPLIRVMVEALTDEICQEQVGKVIAVMNAEGISLA